MTQHEKPGINPRQLCVSLGLAPDTPVRVSGGMIENFREGWAVDIMSSGRRAHFFKRDEFLTSTALCGVGGKVRWLYGEGNYPRCSRCDGRVLAAMKRSR